MIVAPLRGMIRPASPASIGMTATLLVTLMFVSTEAGAAGINLLQPITAQQVRIVFDARESPMVDDDAATARLDGECVAVDDPKQRYSVNFGKVSWTRGRLSWEWDGGREPSIVYLICLDRPRASWTGAGSDGSGGAGSMAMLAALSANSSPVARMNVPISLTPMPAPTSFEIGPTPFIDWPGTADSPEDDPVVPPAPPETITTGPALLDLPSALPAIAPVESAAPLGPPALIDPPGDMAPVPEPSTLLLLGSGVAMAWRAARKHQ